MTGKFLGFMVFALVFMFIGWYAHDTVELKQVQQNCPVELPG